MARYRHNKATTHVAVSNLAILISRRTGHPVTSRSLMDFAAERKIQPDHIEQHNYFPVGVADLLADQMIAALGEQAATTAAGESAAPKPDGILPGFPAPTPEENTPAQGACPIKDTPTDAMLVELARRGYEVTLKRYPAR